jgi:histidinol-phosphate aminotransferase
MFQIDEITRKNILSLVPYSSARSEFSSTDAILLDANENPYNNPFNRYPDPLQRQLKVAIAQMLDISPDRIFLGNGSDEAIDLLFRAFCEPVKQNAISADPSYGMFEVCARINDVELKRIPLTPEFQLDTERMLQAVDADTRLIFLCSPNNPTGNLMNRESIINLSRNFKGLVVVDEAYIDFADSGSIITCLEEIPNLVILRTFSKAWGLAGVRLGMAIASEQIIAVLNKIKYPYNINLLTQRKVARMLRKIDRRNRWVATIKKEKTKLVEALGKLDHVRKIYPSDANFILVKFTNHKDVLKYLVSEKIVVRNRSTAFMCEGCLRITVGSKHENKLLIRKLQVFEKKNKFQPS